MILCFSFLMTSCLEEIELKNVESKGFLVVESTLTNEYKTQTVKLSRTIQLDSIIPISEPNAIVVIKDDANNSFNFTETDNGIYLSNIKFEVEPNKDYTLEITTNEGKIYKSKPERIIAINEIDNIEAKLDTKPNGDEGISIFVNSNTSNNDAKYYRYEYEETYKIIAPLWRNYRLEIINDVWPDFEVKKVINNEENKICYKTLNSSTIIQTETANLSENNVNFNVLFLEKNDFKISHRYSVLVKQYVQSLAAFTYFKTLKKISGNQGIFTQNQPGLIVGNLSSVSDNNEKVIGFFEVASVSKKRYFFNYEEYYPNNEVDFITDCSTIAPPLFSPNPYSTSSPLIEAIRRNYMYYLDNGDPTLAFPGIYLLVPKPCGDCTVLGSNIKPTFWID